MRHFPPYNTCETSALVLWIALALVFYGRVSLETGDPHIGAALIVASVGTLFCSIHSEQLRRDGRRFLSCRANARILVRSLALAVFLIGTPDLIFLLLYSTLAPGFRFFVVIDPDGTPELNVVGLAVGVAGALWTARRLVRTCGVNLRFGSAGTASRGQIR